MEFNVKEIYCAGHFGNWYECAWPNEYKEFLKEMKFWGFNWYSDWFVTTDSGSPENYYCASTLSQTLFERKRINFKNAYKLNFNLDLLICPNHVFLDQLKEERFFFMGLPVRVKGCHAWPIRAIAIEGVL